jgi:hypothetical protein
MLCGEVVALSSESIIKHGKLGCEEKFEFLNTKPTVTYSNRYLLRG